MSKVVIQDLIKIFRTSVSAALPENLIKKSIGYNPITHQLTILSNKYNLKNKDVYVVGAGKAVQYMAKEVENVLQSKIKAGIVSIPVGSLQDKSSKNKILYLEGAKNNLPDEQAEITTNKIRDLALKLTKDDFLLVLISGGGSALLPLPKYPITLQEKVDIIKKLANSGADIAELNTVRKRISLVKGGQLALQAQPAQVVTLILSDVVGDPLDIIASGPTIPNEDSPDDAINVLKKYNLYDKMPSSMKKALEQDPFERSKSCNVQNILLGSNKLSIAAAVFEAKQLKYYPIELSNKVVGNVRDLAEEYIKLVKIFCEFRNDKFDINQMKNHIETLNITGMNIKNIDEDISSIKTKNLCLVLGGETTVNVKGSGLGGRNQQLALEFSKSIHNFVNEFKDHTIYFLSAGTDGIDGPTDAAGAIGYLELISDSKQANIDAKTFIDNNDSYNFFKSFKNGELHVITGHTNTNVMDIHLIIIQKLQNCSL